MHRHGRVERISEWDWREAAGRQNRARRCNYAHFLDHVLVLPGTALGLEMLLQETHIDVCLATDLVLNDVGATIHVLNCAGRESDGALGSPDRIAECLVALDLHDLLDGLYSRIVQSSAGHARIAAVWENRRLVAHYAALIAESAGEIPAEDAYLAGLLDDRGAIAAALGWPIFSRKHLGAGESLAARGRLPRSLLSAFGQTPDFRRPDHWNYILDTARELAHPHMTRVAQPLLDGNDHES